MHYVIDESTALDVHNKGITEDLLIILSQYENMDKSNFINLIIFSSIKYYN